MAEEVKVPGVGKQNKQTVYIVGGVAGAYVLWRWYAARKSAAAAAAAGPQPLTPVDTSNLGANQGNVGFSNPAPGGATSVAAPTGLATNADWTQKVETDLSGLGYDAQMVAAAIGLYLASQPLSLDQQNIIRQAWAFEGKPPQNTNLPIIPAQTPPSPTPTPTPEPSPSPTPTPSPAPDPHAGMHLQPPQVATLEHGRSLVQYAKGVYPVDTQTHLNTLIALNPTLGPNDMTHPTMLIRTSDARWVPN